MSEDGRSPSDRIADAIERIVIHEVARRDKTAPNDTVQRAAQKAKRDIQAALDDYAMDIIRIMEVRNGSTHTS